MNVPSHVLSATSVRTRLADYAELTKPRITTLVVLTAWVGYIVAGGGSADLTLLLHTLLGTALTCAGTSVLNQVWERERDARMRRTRHRPLPAGRLQAAEALVFGASLALAGLVELAWFVNPLASLVAGATLVAYLFVYTPLKTRTWWCTTVGAVPGAAPPLIGWAAARGTLDLGAAALFLIQFAWQLPHFYAIAWMYRDDYARAGFPMLSVLDTDGRRTGRQIVAWTAALVALSLLPVLRGDGGWLYGVAALVLGAAFFRLALEAARRHDAQRARRVFFASVVYLPLLFGVLVLDTLLL
ncbi:MAG TPA: heme o synthase [Candidatus Krumholzibacteria bacterium]|nr:heme o synthase [Candidatus Krumholzibacteria bacterium]